MASRLSATDVLARIMNDSDSGSEFELTDDVRRTIYFYFFVFAFFLCQFYTRYLLPYL